MAKGKSVKVDYKGIKLVFENDELLGTLEVVDEETGEVSTSDVNVTTSIKDFLQTLDEDDKVTINVKKFKPMTAKSRAKTYTYGCGCGYELKSKSDTLNVHCNNCGEDFVRND